jgi:tryptophan-rich sensory protein
VWVPLKLLQTGALTIIFRLVERQVWQVPTLVFLLHLTLGDLWNRVFFGEKRIGFGLSVMFAFYGSLAAACYSFYSVKPLAAYLLIPTAVWVFIATSLNYSIWLMNGQETRFPIKKA